MLRISHQKPYCVSLWNRYSELGSLRPASRYELFHSGTTNVRVTQSQVITTRSTLLTSSAGDDDQLIEDDSIFSNTKIDFPSVWPNLFDIHMDNSVPVTDIQQTVPNDMDDLLEDWPEEALPWSTFSGAWTTHSDGSLIEGLGSSSQPRSSTPPLARSYLTGSEDDSFALDLEPDHEQEDANMEDADFERVMFHPSLSSHLAELTFLGCQEQPGGVEEFDVLVDEEWSCEDELLFDLSDVFGDSSSLGVEDEAGSNIVVSQVPDRGSDQDIFLQAKNNTADQEYDFDTHFGMDGQVVQGSTDDCFTDVWDL